MAQGRSRHVGPPKLPGQLVGISHTAISSGAEKVLLRVLGAAMESAWAVSCAAPPGHLGAQLDELAVARVSIPELKLPAGPRPIALGRLALRYLRAALVLRRACRRADVVLANSLFALPPLLFARPRAPVVVLVHDVIRKPSWRWLLRRCRGVVQTAVAVSDAVAEPLAAAGLPVEVVRNGTPWPVEPVGDEPPAPLVVGCAAALTGWKGQDVLLDAVARLSRRDIRVELAGGRLPKGDAFADALGERVRRPDLAGRVQLLGPLPDAVERMRTWTATVVPSVEPEAGPLAPLEAMSIGVPVIGTDLGGTAEVVGEAGLLVPPGDPEALATAIERLVDDRALWRRCHAAGPRQIAAALTLDAQLESLLRVLRDVADESETRRGVGTVFVVPDFEPALGGTSRQVGNQARSLVRRGHRVTVLTRRLDRSWPRVETLDGVEVVRLGLARRGRFPELVMLAATSGWLLRHRERSSVVHAVDFSDFAVSAAVAGLLRSTSVVWAGLGDVTEDVGEARSPLRRLQARLRLAVLRRCRHVALSPMIADELASTGLGEQTTVIPVPVDQGHFRPPTLTERARARRRLRLDGGTFVVVYTGHLRALKRIDLLVEAFARLVARHPEAHLLIVGGSQGVVDPSETELRRQVVATGVADRITFSGPVSDVRSYLWAADLFVLPSAREGLPNSLLEAMSCGLPCVAPPSAGAGEVLGDGAGLVPASNAPSDLLPAMVAVAEDPALRRRLASSAIERASRYDPELVADAYERLYAEMTRSSGRRADVTRSIETRRMVG